ncbi:MAG: putative ABC transporter [Streblomastix strix]|uniref:Putative ABC transporter n=1 Tax=Streblomastix strix TaxID=222440 RepID=A0A5J4VPH9_9EUKA|nr:MAG: putative ABC transporter [Streblomastix strix]
MKQLEKQQSANIAAGNNTKPEPNKPSLLKVLDHEVYNDQCDYARNRQVPLCFPGFFLRAKVWRKNQQYDVNIKKIIIPLVFVNIDWGVSTPLSFAVVQFLFPIQGFLAAQKQKSKRSYLTLNDKRNKITNKVLQGIRVVKYSGLESVFIERVEEVREKQLDEVFTFTLVIQSLVSIMRCAPLFVNVSSMSVFVAVTEQIPSKNESTAVEVIDGTFIWNDPPEIPMSKQEKLKLEKEAQRRKQNISTGKDQIKEQNNKIINQEMQVIDENRRQQSIIESSPSPSSSSSPTSSSSPYSYESASSTREGDLKRPKLADIYFKLQKGILTMVIRSVGSGKTSIGSALIGDFEKQSNITFGCEYDEDKYNDVIRVFALEPDFQTLAAGDMTAIGEKGVNLSGGQKAKIQLARAVYSDRDIYILDHPLSAVDAHIGRILFEECIEGRLKDKTRLLITNQLQYIDRSDNIILLDNGRITAQRTSQQLKEQGIDFQKILNRFTGDVSQTDQVLYQKLTQVMNSWINLIGQIVIIAVDTPFFLYIGLPTILIFFILMKIYSRASRNLQRLEAISRSPMLSHFSETVSGAGLSTIRSYNLEKDLEKKFEKLNDDWSIRFIIYFEATLFTSFISSLFMIGVILIGWKQMEASKLTVAIIASTGFGFLGTMIVQLFVELESKMISFDRIHIYSSKLPQEKSYFRKKVKYRQGKWASEEDATEEAKFDPNGQLEITPDNQWPEYGMVQFDNISFRYRNGQPYVQNDVNFAFKGGEKIEVCGRTGAGKTSLLFALFRLVELVHILQPSIIDVNTGFPIEVDKTDELNKKRVLIDGIDISKVGISRVRRSIAIIPLDPTLFTRTLSYNLDIANRCNDEASIFNAMQLLYNIYQARKQGEHRSVRFDGYRIFSVFVLQLDFLSDLPMLPNQDYLPIYCQV